MQREMHGLPADRVKEVYIYTEQKEREIGRLSQKGMFLIMSV